MSYSEILTPKDLMQTYNLKYSTVLQYLNTERGKELILPRKDGAPYRITAKNFEKLINNDH